MGNVHPGAPLWLLDALQKTGRYRIFVETGTAGGDTALAAGDRFDTVITLEADPQAAAAAHERLSGRKGILPVTGDSRELLPRLMPRLAGPAVFWLDAHYCGPGSFGAGDECPLLAEIAAIAAADQPHLLLIDDARLFAAPPPSPHDAALWPPLAAVLTALDAGAGRDVALVDDVLIAVPCAESIVWDTLFPDGRPQFLTPPHG